MIALGKLNKLQLKSLIVILSQKYGYNDENNDFDWVTVISPKNKIN